MTQSAKTAPAGKLVPINGGTIKLKSSDWPLLGKPNAKHIFVEMFDYTCKHCRSTNKAIEAAKETMGDDLAIISLPVPMNKDCNTTVQTTNAAHTDACRLARLAIAVWRVDRAAFPPFHQWLFSSDVAPSYDSALAEANQRVDPAKLATELGNTLCDQYLSRNVELYKRAGEGAIPKLIFKQTTIVGEFTSGSSLADLIRQYTAK
jgi:protein-disulfide isomerase